MMLTRFPRAVHLSVPRRGSGGLWGRIATVAVLLMGVSHPIPAALPTADSQGQALPSLAPMLERVTPAVVNISTQAQIPVQDNPLLRDPFFRRFFNLPDRMPEQPRTQSLGSGVVVDAARGYVLTNFHVIDKAAEITVTLQDGQRYNATVIGKDPAVDIAVIKIDADGLVGLRFADSDSARVGDFVVAIGNPFGLGQTVTSGIISAMGRSGLGIEGYEDFIQTDASINPGNSGGALVNLRGELVGINTAILAPSGGNVGIGFAIPSNMVDKIMQQLVEYGEVRRGLLGVSAQDLTPDLAQAFGLAGTNEGVVVVEVVDGSPADQAGLRSGDIVTHVNGRPVKGAQDMRNAVGLLRVGEEVAMDVLRSGKKMRIAAVIVAPEIQRLDGAKLNSRLEGATFVPITQDSPLYGHVEGVIVGELASGSRAAYAGLRRGDVVVSVNQQKVSNLKELEQAVSLSKTRVLLNVRRGGSALFLLLQ